MNFLITGITGTLGRKIMHLALENPDHTVYGFSRDEQKLRALPTHDRLHVFCDDVRFPLGVYTKLKDVQIDVIFHLAALKCIEFLEENILPCVETNVAGTHNMLRLQRDMGISRLVLASTDKAVEAINVYGATKLIAERLVTNFDRNNIVCRYGNVIGSRGSVIQSFVETLHEARQSYITDPRMTRFFISQDKAAQFVYTRAFEPINPEKQVQIPRMKAARMIDIEETVKTILGIQERILNVTGIRAGEKLHEVLQREETHFDGRGNVEGMRSDTYTRYTEEELTELIAPVIREITE